jgi:hypothetical protein
VANDAASKAYDDLTFSMSEDEDYDVVIADDGMLVRGTLFAFLEGDDLVVELPEERASDLKERGVADASTTAGHPSRDWVRVSDIQLWPELARESHQYVGEPPVGGDS